MLSALLANVRHERPLRSPAGPVLASERIFQTVVADAFSASPLISPANPLVTPGRILSREPEHELADLAVNPVRVSASTL